MTGERLSLDHRKRALRVQALAARRAAHADLAETAGERIAASFLAAITCPPGAVVAGYWPLGEEADVRPLLERLAARGIVVALPIVTARGAALVFRRWQPGDRLDKGSFGTSHPPADAPPMVPDMLLVPLLAFDHRGIRLGYGGGYYDRTLAGLRARAPVAAIGIAYAAQELAEVPHDDHDERLDWIVTEEAAREILV